MGKGPCHFANSLLVDDGNNTRTKSSTVNDLSRAFLSYHDFISRLLSRSVMEAMSFAASSRE